MQESFEDWLVTLSQSSDEGVLKRLPNYLSDQFAKTLRDGGNMTIERERLVRAFEANAPPSRLKERMLKIITTST